MLRSDDEKLRVQEATDVVQLIGEHVSLRPRGKEFLGLCPFHDDKNPSMHVSPVKQIYKCFSCGAGGDVFSFVMNLHKLSFPEALRYLAERSGITLKLSQVSRSPAPGNAGNDAGEHPGDIPGAGVSDRQMILTASKQAMGFFCARLGDPQRGELAQRYLRERGISGEMIKAFQLGYAPDAWDMLTQQVRQQRWSPRGFELAGLTILNKQQTGHYDRFRHRLIFPIHDALGRPIAFGGRKLRQEDEPKYLNSPESTVFNKSATLYGLHLAKKAIIDQKTAIVVEGYTDVIACHQAGVCHVVATLGTALTQQHLQALNRLCEKVVLVFDADQAGVKAGDRAVEVFFAGSVDVAVAILPTGKDPADLLSDPDGLELWYQTIARADDALAYKLNRMKQDLDAADTLSGREKVAQRYLQDLARLRLSQQSVLRRAMIVQRLSQLLGLSQAAVETTLKRVQSSVVRKNAGIVVPMATGHTGGMSAEAVNPVGESPAKVGVPLGVDPGAEEGTDKNPRGEVALADDEPKMKALQAAKRHIIGCLLRRPDLVHETLSDGRTFDEVLPPAAMGQDAAGRLYEVIYHHLCQDPSITLRQLLAELASQGQHGLASLATQAEAEADPCTEPQLEAMFKAAADLILKSQQEQRYDHMKRLVLETPHEDRTTDHMPLWREMTEHQRANPSPIRIARLEHRGQ